MGIFPVIRKILRKAIIKRKLRCEIGKRSFSSPNFRNIRTSPNIDKRHNRTLQIKIGINRNVACILP